MFKQARKALHGKNRTKFDGSFGYLSELENLVKLKCQVKKPEDFLNLDSVEEALKVNVSYKLLSILKKQSETKNKISKKDFLNTRYALDIVDVSKTHIRYVTFWFFRQVVDSDKIKCDGVKNNLRNLCMLYGLSHLNIDATSCYDCGYFGNHGQDAPFSELVLEAIKLLNTTIRP